MYFSEVFEKVSQAQHTPSRNNHEALSAARGGAKLGHALGAGSQSVNDAILRRDRHVPPE